MIRSTTAAKSEGVGATRRVITSIDEFVDPSVNAHMVPMVLHRDAMRAEIVTAAWNGIAVEVQDYSFPLATRGESLAHRVGLIAPIRRIGLAHVNGKTVAPGSVLHAVGGAAELVAATTGPVEVASLSLTAEVLDQAAHKLGVEIDLPGRGEFHAVRAVSWERLRSLLLGVRQTVRDRGEIAPSAREATTVSDALTEIAVHCFAADDGAGRLLPRARLNSVHIVRRCEEYARVSNYQSVTLADLCRASEVSERRIRHAFYDCYCMSPTAYLRVAALNEVRHALLAEAPARDAVSRAASDFGFWHLSRFAGQYRALFGECPSVTFAHGRNVATG